MEEGGWQLGQKPGWWERRRPCALTWGKHLWDDFVPYGPGRTLASLC